MSIKEALSNLSNGKAVLYKHTIDQKESTYLLADTNQIDLSVLKSYIEYGKLYRVITSTEIIKSITSTDTIHNNAIVISFDCSENGLATLCSELGKGNFQDLSGDDHIPLNTFPDGNVLNINSPDSFIAELISLMSETPKFLIVAKVLEKVNPNISCITTKEIELSRIDNPALLSHTGLVDTDLVNGEFEVHSFYSPLDHLYHWAFTTKNFSEEHQESPLIRIESECLTGHVFGSLLCDCGQQLKEGLRKIQENGYGALIYLRQEGRGIGLLAKIKAYKLQQEDKLDTVDANLALGEPADSRDYLIGAQILKYFNKNTIQLLTNNPKKEIGLKQFNLNIEKRVEHIILPGQHNKKYLQTKVDRLGHLM
jgi:3,4-dihydroxy 2-butanone 4-phosphate synthase/GTP cyclohydrolase II